jgi:hypothetical protein
VWKFRFQGGKKEDEEEKKEDLMGQVEIQVEGGR